VLLARSGSRQYGNGLNASCATGFRIATGDLNVLQRAWRIETEANKGDFAWYPDMESMRYCFYVKPEAPPRADHASRPTTPIMAK
jgi:hypothetical protein